MFQAIYKHRHYYSVAQCGMMLPYKIQETSCPQRKSLRGSSHPELMDSGCCRPIGYQSRQIATLMQCTLQWPHMQCAIVCNKLIKLTSWRLYIQSMQITLTWQAIHIHICKMLDGNKMIQTADYLPKTIYCPLFNMCMLHADHACSILAHKIGGHCCCSNATGSHFDAQYFIILLKVNYLYNQNTVFK